MKKIAYIAVVALAIVACNKEEGAKIDSIKVVPETKTLYTDEALPELAVVLDPEDANVTVEWTSSDPELVTVSDKGVLAFAVKDIEDAEKTVTITAKAGEKTASCVLTVKGQISRYEVLDFTADFGFQMLDRNVGAKSKEEVGNYYQWGKNTPVAANDETEVNASQLNESTVGAHTTVGPFAYVRPNSKIGDHVKVGDFVEIKNSVIGNGTKISHLTYVGDSDCGERINFGCGTVTTNYDGFKKFRCTIGDDAFIGCNTNLIAPVTVGNGSYIAAGSTITDEVPADSLAIARERQVNKPGWAEQWRAAHEKK